MDALGGLAAFSLIAFVSCITPGPNNALAAVNGARFGWRACIGQALGVTTGCAALTVLTMVGIGAGLAAQPAVRGALAMASAAYLLMFGWRLWAGDGLRSPRTAKPQTLSEAAGFQVINAKAWTAATAGSAAVMAVGGPRPAVIAAAVAIQSAICFASVMAWSVGGGALSHLADDAASLRLFNRAMALALGLVALWLVFDAFKPLTVSNPR